MLSAEALVFLALRRGLSVLAITDHDSVDAVEPALRAAQSTGLTVIPALELSALTEDGRDIHILGYGVDHTCPVLESRLSAMRDERVFRAGRILDLMAADGISIALADVIDGGEVGAVGRCHIARALVRSGVVGDVPQAFRDYLGRGCTYYVSKQVCGAEEAIALISEAGGLPVVAHPAISGVTELIPSLVSRGLKGIEAYHADHTAQQTEQLALLARQSGVLVTGGTDFHGEDAPNPPLGSVGPPPEAVQDLLDALAVQ